MVFYKTKGNRAFKWGVEFYNMKIVHVVISNCYTDGWAYQENLLPEAHVRLGHDVTVIATTINSFVPSDQSCKPNNEYYINGVKVIRIAPSFKLLLNKFALFSNLTNVMWKLRPELIFLHGFGFLSINEFTKYKKLDPKCIIVADNHADEGNCMLRFKWLNKWLIQKGLWRYGIQRNLHAFDFVYYTCQQTKTFAHDYFGIPNGKMRYLPMGGDVSKEQLKNSATIRQRWRTQIGISSDSLILVSGGRFSEHKKILELISAFQGIKSNDIQLLLFGKFLNNEYKKQVMNEVNKDPRIKFIGWLTPIETTELFLSADLAVFTGTQSVIWRNAVACGLPIICRYTFGAEEMDVGGNAIHIYSDAPFAWKQAMEHVIGATDLLDRMRNNSIEKGINFFDNNRIAQIVIDDAIVQACVHE